MRKHWMLGGLVCLVAVLAIGAIACSDTDDDGEAPTAGEAPAATETTDDVPVGLPSGETSTVVVTDGILTDSAGNTLYVFDNDDPGVSNCADVCLDIWPTKGVIGDLTAGAGAGGTLATITRDDGITQVTYDGQPLYYYANDEAPGDRKGDNVGGVWHIIEVE